MTDTATSSLPVSSTELVPSKESNSGELFTIGHSSHAITRFVELVKMHHIDVLADVRSVPSSRFAPQFNRLTLQRSLKDHGIDYVFLGQELGARPGNSFCFIEGRVDFDRLASQPEFGHGLRRVREGMRQNRVALLCTEQDPLDCHRTILVSEVLYQEGISITHIRSDGSLEPHQDAITRLMGIRKLDQPDLFRDEPERRSEALRLQEHRIAYADREPETVLAVGE